MKDTETSMKVNFKRLDIDISSAYPHSGLQFQIKYGDVGSTYFFLSMEEMKELKEIIDLTLKVDNKYERTKI